MELCKCQVLKKKKKKVEEIHCLRLVNSLTVRLNEVESSDKSCKIAKVTSGQLVKSKDSAV